MIKKTINTLSLSAFLAMSANAYEFGNTTGMSKSAKCETNSILDYQAVRNDTCWECMYPIKRHWGTGNFATEFKTGNGFDSNISLWRLDPRKNYDYVSPVGLGHTKTDPTEMAGYQQGNTNGKTCVCPNIYCKAWSFWGECVGGWVNAARPGSGVMSYYFPDNFIESVKVPYCSPAMGIDYRETLGGISFDTLKMGTQGDSKTGNDLTFMNAHIMPNVLALAFELEKLNFSTACLSSAVSSKTWYPTELLPLWHSDITSIYTTATSAPGIAVIAILGGVAASLISKDLAKAGIAAAAVGAIGLYGGCIADSFMSNAGKALNTGTAAGSIDTSSQAGLADTSMGGTSDYLFWCNGSWGMGYPMSGNTASMDYVADSLNVASRLTMLLSSNIAFGSLPVISLPEYRPGDDVCDAAPATQVAIGGGHA